MTELLEMKIIVAVLVLLTVGGAYLYKKIEEAKEIWKVVKHVNWREIEKIESTISNYMNSKAMAD